MRYSFYCLKAPLLPIPHHIKNKKSENIFCQNIWYKYFLFNVY
jgi:hypothetical protein